MEIKISNGTVKIKDFIDRKTKKLYQGALFNGLKLREGMTEKDVEVDFMNAIEANEVLVKNMIISINDNHTIDDDFDKMDDADFNLVLGECIKMIKKTEQSKKK